MIKKNQRFINLTNMVLDIIIVFFVCIFFVSISNPVGAGLFAFCFWFSLAFQGFYNTDRLYRLRQKAVKIIVAGVFATLVLSFFFHWKSSILMVEKVLMIFVITTFILTAKYVCMRILVNFFRSKGWNLKHVVVVGTGATAIQYARDMDTKKSLGYHVFGFIGNNNGDLPKPILGSFEEIEDFLYGTEADEIVIALSPEEEPLVRKIVLLCLKNGLRYNLISSEKYILPGQMEINVVGQSKIMIPNRCRLDNLGWAVIKRFFDIILSLLGIVVLSPIMFFIMIGVRLSGPGPILFCQERVGYNRRIFTMFKFRSMKSNEKESEAWTSADDLRRTPFGRFIRKFSLDELPQLWNVLIGSMSLVGPRPELPYYVEQFRESIPMYMLKHQVRPGITGWAQVNGYRGDTSIEERIKYDIWYIENWTIWLDIRIIIKTIFGGMVNQEILQREEKEDGNETNQ